MRLLFVGTHREPGGAASHFISLTTALAAAGHTVAAVAFPGGTIWRALEHDSRISLYSGEFTKKLDWSALRSVRKAVREIRPDWIISAFEIDYWGTAFIGAFSRIPVAFFLHHAGLKNSSLRVIPRLVSQFVLPSEFLHRWAITRGVSSTRTRVLYNPVDTSHFRPNSALRAAQRAALGIAPDDIVVGYVGRFETNKGVVPFAESVNRAMARTPRLRALWVGFGSIEGELDRAIENSGMASRHIKRPWCDDVLPYYSAMDVLALPSAGPESFGRVLVEAQACGIPVVGSAVGGIGETMDAGVTGRLVDSTDVDGWTDTLCDLAACPERRRVMGDAGRAFVHKTFGTSVIVNAFERMLQSPRIGANVVPCEIRRSVVT